MIKKRSMLLSGYLAQIELYDALNVLKKAVFMRFMINPILKYVILENILECSDKQISSLDSTM